jgi:transposase-like protein
MKNKNKVFSEEFKRNAVNHSNNSEKSLQEISDELGIGFLV